MYSWLYRDSPLVIYPLVALFAFLGVFIAVVLRTYGRGAKKNLDAASQLPLFDGEEHYVNGNDNTRGASHV